VGAGIFRGVGTWGMSVKRRKTGLLGCYHFQLSRIPARITIISGIAPKSDDLERKKWDFQGTHLYRYHRNKEKPMESMATEEQSLEIQVSTFLADLAHANHSPQTCRAYASDLAQLCAFHQGPLQTITVEVLRKFFEEKCFKEFHHGSNFLCQRSSSAL
jgi:Phage integrase, N-terminal SAM-like domain